MQVIGYVRVSTEEQAAEGVSLDAQRGKLHAYAALHDLDLVGVEVDAGVSAKTLQRPGLTRALDWLKPGVQSGLLIAKLDRLTRSVADLQGLIDRYFGEHTGWQLLSVADAIDTRTAAGRMVINLLTVIAQWERETIVERTRDAFRHKKGNGERLGQIPYGFRLGENGKTLIACNIEGEAIAEARRLAGSGRSLRQIAAALDARGFPTKSGRPWSHTTVAGLLGRGPTRTEEPTHAPRPEG
jgi:site-specific DNA recombinase